MDERYDFACCFTGHRKIPDNRVAELYKLLDVEVSWMIAHGITTYYAGGALGFDTIAALTVIDAKKRNQGITLNLAIPCPGQTRGWSPRDVEIYNYIMECADTVTYLAKHYYNGVMQLRNRYMVDHSQYCVCYCSSDIGSKTGRGGTLYTARYAIKQGVQLVNVHSGASDTAALEFAFSDYDD
ncbi:MAG: DUF1273 domain-containing protein [Clostridiales bacterium]|nr:DUF1273 domain-containing protein [Clostridiales bacterium]